MNPLKISIAVLISVSLPSNGQQIINGSRTLLGNWDASGAATTKPLKAGTAIPAACGLGEMFFKTDATAGANVFLCTGTNTWTQISSQAGSLTSVFGRTGAVTSQNGDYSFSQISGQATVGQLPSSVQYFQSGAGAPAGSCTPGQNGYLDTINLDYWFCDIANGWKKTLSTTNSGSFTLTGQTGTVPATPTAGLATIYLNSTDKTVHSVNDSGTDIQYAGWGEANTWGAFLQDFSASTIKIPLAAGFTTVTNGGLGYDSTLNQLHAAINGVDSVIPTRVTAAPVSGNCVKWSSNLQLQDSGAVCGGGGGSGTVNAGTAAHLAYYASSTAAVSDTGATLNWVSPILTIGVSGVTTGILNLASATATGSVSVTPASASGNVTLTLPAVTGTAAVAATSTAPNQALFATSTAGAPGYRSIASTDLPNPVYQTTFTSQTSITILGATHLRATRFVNVQCWDSSTTPHTVEPDSVTVNTGTFDIVIKFANLQTGACSVL